MTSQGTTEVSSKPGLRTRLLGISGADDVVVEASAVVVETKVAEPEIVSLSKVVVVSPKVVDKSVVASSVVVDSALKVDTKVVETDKSEADAVSEAVNVVSCEMVDEPVSTEVAAEVSIEKDADSVSVLVGALEVTDEEGLHGDAEASWHSASSSAECVNLMVVKSEPVQQKRQSKRAAIKSIFILNFAFFLI
jgi:hypothetical protein